MHVAIEAAVKTALRISAANTAFDGEVADLVATAQRDLVRAGVHPSKAGDTTDPLIRRAIIQYAKANFGMANPEADRFQKSYDLLLGHLTLSQEYTQEGEG